MTLVTPHTFSASEEVTSAEMQTLTDAISQSQGGAPSAGALDHAALDQVVTQSLNNTTWTSITFTSERVDSAGGHSTSSNTSRYVAAHTGWYQVNAGIAYAFNATGSRGARLAVNGSPIGRRVLLPAIGTTYTTEISISRMISLTAGQYLELQGFQSSGGALSTAYTADAEGSYLELRWCHS